MLDEKFTVRKKVRNKYRIALVYPSTYKVAISNLGFRIIYHLLNLDDHIYCERFTAESDRSIETGSHLRELGLIMFSYQYELDLFKIARQIVRLNLFNKPKIIGGPCTCNPYPLKHFSNYVYIGEAETTLIEFVNGIMDGMRPEDLASLEGLFIPGVSEEMRKTYPRKLNTFLPAFQVSSRRGVLGDSLLLDVSRGCKWSCLFCLGKSFYAPYRERSLDQLADAIREGLIKGGYESVALIASDLSRYSMLDELVEIVRGLRRGRSFGLIVPSLRADAINEKLLEVIVESGEKTITVAPESCEELRCRIGKNFSDESLLQTCMLLRKHGISRVKLYVMFGLPGETMKDVEKTVKLVKDTKNMGFKVRVSANPFVPKPHTPMESKELEDLKILRRKLKLLKKELGGMLNTDGIRQAYLQAIIARGDERIGDLVLHVVRKYAEPTLAAIKREAERMGISIDNYAKRGSEEKPWKRIRLA